MTYTGFFTFDDAELAIGQCRLGVHGTCVLNIPWHIGPENNVKLGWKSRLTPLCDPSWVIRMKQNKADHGDRVRRMGQWEWSRERSAYFPQLSNSIAKRL